MFLKALTCLCVLIVLGSSGASYSIPMLAIAKSQSATSVLIGVAIDTETGESISDVVVTINGMSGGAISNGAGIFSITEVAYGAYTLIADHSDFAATYQPIVVSEETSEVTLFLQKPPAATTIDASGGTVTTPDGSVGLTIPANALPSSTEISIQSLPSILLTSNDPSVYYFGIQLQPIGLVLSAAATLSVELSFPIREGTTLPLWLYEPLTGVAPESIPLLVTDGQLTAFAPIPHFSQAFIALPIGENVQLSTFPQDHGWVQTGEVWTPPWGVTPIPPIPIPPPIPYPDSEEEDDDGDDDECREGDVKPPKITMKLERDDDSSEEVIHTLNNCDGTCIENVVTIEKYSVEREIETEVCIGGRWEDLPKLTEKYPFVTVTSGRSEVVPCEPDDTCSIEPVSSEFCGTGTSVYHSVCTGSYGVSTYASTLGGSGRVAIQIQDNGIIQYYGRSFQQIGANTYYSGVLDFCDTWGCADITTTSGTIEETLVFLSPTHAIATVYVTLDMNFSTGGSCHDTGVQHWLWTKCAEGE